VLRRAPDRLRRGRSW